MCKMLYEKSGHGFVLIMINGPASRKALVEKQVLHIGPTWKNMFYKKNRFVLLIGPVPPMRSQ